MFVLPSPMLGGAIARSTGEYLTFALPGIIVLNMLFVTMYVGMGLNTDLTKGVLDGCVPCPSRDGLRWQAGSRRPGKAGGSIALLLTVAHSSASGLARASWG
jgi:hypothetical protein